MRVGSLGARSWRSAGVYEKRTVEESLPELHQLQVCEFCLVGNPFAESLDSLVSGLLVYRVFEEGIGQKGGEQLGMPHGAENRQGIKCPSWFLYH